MNQVSEPVYGYGPLTAMLLVATFLAGGPIPPKVQRAPTGTKV
jgi:hypothetical protein